jgi:hypothetical protein
VCAAAEDSHVTTTLLKVSSHDPVAQTEAIARGCHLPRIEVFGHDGEHGIGKRHSNQIVEQPPPTAGRLETHNRRPEAFDGTGQ